MLSDKPLLSDDPIKLGLSQPSSMGALQSPDDDPFDDEQKKMLGGLGLTPEQMAGVGKLFGASKTSPNNGIRDKLLDEYMAEKRNMTPKERVARVAYANGDLSGNPHDGTFAGPTKSAKRKGSYTEEELKAIGGNWDKTDDPLRGNRL
jgi:hypothetical protein